MARPPWTVERSDNRPHSRSAVPSGPRGSYTSVRTTCLGLPGEIRCRQQGLFAGRPRGDSHGRRHVVGSVLGRWHKKTKRRAALDGAYRAGFRRVRTESPCGGVCDPSSRSGARARRAGAVVPGSGGSRRWRTRSSGRTRRPPAATLLLVAVAFIVTATLLPARDGAIGVDPQVCAVVTPAAEVHVVRTWVRGFCGSALRPAYFSARGTGSGSDVREPVSPDDPRECE